MLEWGLEWAPSPAVCFHASWTRGLMSTASHGSRCDLFRPGFGQTIKEHEATAVETASLRSQRENQLDTILRLDLG